MPHLQYRIKRVFDCFGACLGLLLLGWLILLLAFLAFLDTGKNGFFTQARVGKNAEPFQLFKIRSLRKQRAENTGFVHQFHISPLGRFLRKTKLDELPQLWNVLIGNMSFVGPRPDVPGFADKLEGEDSEILQLRPGITGPATLRFKNEEALLADIAQRSEGDTDP